MCCLPSGWVGRSGWPCAWPFSNKRAAIAPWRYRWRRRPQGALADEFRQAGIEPLTVPKQGRGLDFGLPARLAAEFCSKSATVVHAHNPQALIYAALAGKAAGATVVYTCHGQNSLATGRLWLTRLASLAIDAYVGVSPRIVERARRYRECPEAKLLVIENGVDLSAFRPDADTRRQVRAELGLPEGAWVVGTVGRLVEDKNPGLLLRASLPLLGPDARLVFVGDGPLYPGTAGRGRPPSSRQLRELPGCASRCAAPAGRVGCVRAVIAHRGTSPGSPGSHGGRAAHRRHRGGRCARRGP